jgi:hypothetical protein
VYGKPSSVQALADRVGVAVQLFGDLAAEHDDVGAAPSSSCALQACPYRKGTSNMAKKSRVGARPGPVNTGMSLRRLDRRRRCRTGGAAFALAA